MKRSMLVFGLTLLGITLHLCLSSPSQAQVIRGLYVNSFDEILGNRQLEDELCDYCYAAGVNHVLFYSLHKIDLNNPLKANQLRQLIRRLRTQYGVRDVGAVHESYESFEFEIHPFNMDPDTDPEERFNVYNLEFEYWSTGVIESYYCERYLRHVGFPCTEEGAFMYVKKSLEAMRNFKKDLPDLLTEVYVGWLDSVQARSLSGLVDLILPATYRTVDGSGDLDLYSHPAQRNRIAMMAAGGPVQILPIFNGSQNDSAPNLFQWLSEGNSVCEPWNIYLDEFSQETDTLILNRVSLEGYVWFKYTRLPPVMNTLPEIGQISGDLAVKTGDAVEFGIMPVAGADRYRWQFTLHDTVLVTAQAETSIRMVFMNEGLEQLRVEAFGCGSRSGEAIKNIDIRAGGTGVEGSSPERGFQAVYHYPALHIRMNQDAAPYTLELRDFTGRTLASRRFNGPELPLITWDIALEAGMYLITMVSRNGPESQRLLIGGDR